MRGPRGDDRWIWKAPELLREERQRCSTIPIPIDLDEANEATIDQCPCCDRWFVNLKDLICEDCEHWLET
jgi:hypothetical protein